MVDLAPQDGPNENDAGDAYHVYQPLSHGGRTRHTDGAIEVALPYGPIAAQIRKDRFMLVATVFGGLLVLYLVLFPVVASASRKLREQALADELTGLPNRRSLQQEAERLIFEERRKRQPSGETVWLMLLDLDRFKQVNDTFGHSHGDAILVEVCSRLRSVLRDDDFLARVGGDEFCAVVRTTSELAVGMATRLRRAVNELPYLVQGTALTLDASIGLAGFPSHGDDSETLLRHADVAMYAAKKGRTGYRLYASDADPNTAQRLGLTAALRDAPLNGQLRLHYQPKVSLTDGSLWGVEALIRWDHPDHGLLGPAEFLPLAKEANLLGLLTHWVAKEGISQACKWEEAGYPLALEINLGQADLLDSGLADHVNSLLREYGLSPDRLICEITEDEIMAEDRSVEEAVSRLTARGIGLSIDDFGTGHSSLVRLGTLPIEELKLDRTFVRSMLTNRTSHAIVENTISLAHALGLRVVAEGVEERETWEELSRLGCDLAQGYLFSWPLPSDELWRYLSSVRVHVPPSRSHRGL